MSAASRARSLIDGAEGELTEEELKPVVPSLFHTGLIRKEPDATPLPLYAHRRPPAF
jgi:DNA-directed RNA polymerase subunit K/omega